MIDECLKLIQSGQLAEAESRLSSLDATDIEVRTLQAIVCAKTGRIDEAADGLESVLADAPAHVTALSWLASSRRIQGRFEEALVLFDRLVALGSKDPEVFILRGMCLLSLGRAAEAERSIRQALVLNPNSAAAHYNLGLALRMQNRNEEALAAFRRALSLHDSPENRLEVFRQLQQLARWDEAVECLEAGVKRQPNSSAIAEALAAAYGRVGGSDEAARLFKKLSETSPSASNAYAAWLQECGRFPDSISVLRHSLALDPIQGEPYHSLAEAGQYVLDGEPLLEAALKVEREPGLTGPGRMHLAYALGRLYDHEGNYREAMRWYDEANAAAYRGYSVCRTFDPTLLDKEFQAISQLSIPSSGLMDSRPIFIVGMIRSGTTLLDQIVSSHPLVRSVGEGNFWTSEGDALVAKWLTQPPSEEELRQVGERYLRSVDIGPADSHFTDKMPLNYRHLGLISAVLPEAKFLHIRRDPFDTCLSIYFTFYGGWTSFAYKQENIVAFYRAYQRLMEHWRSVIPRDRVLEIDYEELVANPSEVIHGVLDFLDLPWDDACLSHQGNSAPVSTPSRWQARQPIYSSSVGKRERYGPFVGALEELC